MADRERGGVGIPAGGFAYKRVLVESIHGDTAAVVDKFGLHLNVRLDYRHGGGPLPREKEVWIIDRSLGFWTFAALAVANPPVITGSNDGIPALVNLLTAMDEMGLIIDQTTTDRIRADTGHTH